MRFKSRKDDVSELPYATLDGFWDPAPGGIDVIPKNAATFWQRVQKVKSLLFSKNIIELNVRKYNLVVID
jgi:hypothetical protein